MRIKVHPSVLHQQAILANIPKRTGKTLEAWKKEITDAGLNGRKEIKSWIMHNHGFGGGTANMIIAYTTGENPEDYNADSYLAETDRMVDDQYAGRKAYLRPIMEEIVSLADAIGEEVAFSPCKTLISIYRTNVIGHIKPSTLKRVDVGLALGGYEGALDEFVMETGGKEKGDRITHRIALTHIYDVEDLEIEKWLKIAYELDA